MTKIIQIFVIVFTSSLFSASAFAQNGDNVDLGPLQKMMQKRLDAMGGGNGGGGNTATANNNTQQQGEKKGKKGNRKTARKVTKPAQKQAIATAPTCPFGEKEVELEKGEKGEKLEDGTVKTTKSVCMTRDEFMEESFVKWTTMAEEEMEEEVNSRVASYAIFLSIVAIILFIICILLTRKVRMEYQSLLNKIAAASKQKK